MIKNKNKKPLIIADILIRISYSLFMTFPYPSLNPKNKKKKQKKYTFRSLSFTAIHFHYQDIIRSSFVQNRTNLKSCKKRTNEVYHRTYVTTSQNMRTFKRGSNKDNSSYRRKGIYTFKSTMISLLPQSSQKA